jgi:hypothetical protein
MTTRLRPERAPRKKAPPSPRKKRPLIKLKTRKTRHPTRHANKNGTRVAGATVINAIKEKALTPATRPLAPSAVLNAFGMNAMHKAVNRLATVADEFKMMSTPDISIGCSISPGEEYTVATPIISIKKNRFRAERLPLRSSKRPMKKNAAHVAKIYFSSSPGEYTPKYA